MGEVEAIINSTPMTTLLTSILGRYGDVFSMPLLSSGLDGVGIPVDSSKVESVTS
jgi:hypothetical protein